MRTLLLLRHGKALGSEPADDHERPLAEHGRDQAAEIAALLTRLDLRPDVALVSDARRTRETAELVLAEAHASIRPDPTLYAASARTILTIVRGVDDETRRVLVVGHNPGIGELARLLERSGEPQAVIALQQSFPTGALAVFEVDVPHWADLGPASATLTRFIVPKPSIADA